MPRNANQSKQSNYSMGFTMGTGVNFGSLSNILGNGTITYNTSYSVWIKPDFSYNTNTYQTFFGNFASGNNVLLLYYAHDINAFKFAVGDGSGHNFVRSQAFTSDQELGKGEWQHHCVSFDTVNNNAYYYIDNVQVNTSTGLSRKIATNQNFYIGKKWDLTSGGFTGEISQGCIFNYALSKNQVTTLYGDSTNGIGNPMALPIPPIAYYPLGGSAAAFRTPVNTGDQWLIENNAIGDYVFDFASSTISIGDLSSVEGSDFTISLWLNRDSAHSSVIYNSGSAYPNGLIFQSNQNGSFFISVGGGDGTTSTMTITDGIWYNAILTVSGTTAKVYVNGSQLGSDLTVGSARTGIGSGTVIGEYNHGSGYNFNGKLSNVQVFNSALLGPEVETLYNYGSPIQTLANIPQSSNLKAWYKLDATEIYNSTSTEWEISDATAAIKLSTLQNAPGSSAYRVSDSSGVINFPSHASGTLKTSTSIWFYAPSSISSGQYLQLLYAGPNSRLWLGFSGSNQLRCIVGNGAWMIGNYVTMGQWNQFTASIDVVDYTRTVKFYINGQPAGTASQNGGPPISATDGITVSAYGYGTYSEQVLSSNSVFWENVILTDAEVLSHYNSFNVSNGIPTVQPVLSNFPQSSSISGWYKLDGNPKDSSGNSRDANYGSNNNVITGPSVSNVNGQSAGMSQSNLVQSNLQTVAPYSKYAMNFDGNDDIGFGNITNLNSENFTASIWVYHTTTGTIRGIWGTGSTGYNDVFLQIDGDDNYNWSTNNLDPTWVQLTTPAGPTHTWNHITCVRSRSGNLTTRRIYVNGSIAATDSTSISAATGNTTLLIGKLTSNSYYLTGKMSNFSIWNTALTPEQVTEIYNEGLPSNLHNFSGTAPAAWWQLGENSSFNGNDWICADEIGSSNGESDGMGVDALTNGVGTTANGSSTGMSEGSLVGDAPYSTANAISSGMPVTARGTDVPS